MRGSIRILALGMVSGVLWAALAAAAEPSSSPLINSPDFNKAPTFITSDLLTLKAQERFFIYQGNVEVKHADLTITSATLEGNYDQNNKITDMTARTNVVIIKGESMRGTGGRAYYDAAKETVTLLDAPEITQNESTLTADEITIFLKENRSEAKGQVHVKLAGGSGLSGG